MKKSLITGIWGIAVFSSCLTNVSAHSNDNKFPLNPTYSQFSMSKHTLSDSIRLLGADAPLTQAYALTILKQPIIKVDAMSRLANHQKFAKEKAVEWMDIQYPNIIGLNQEIMRYSAKFHSYYSKLYESAGKIYESEEVKAEFVKGFSRLQNEVQIIQGDMEQTLLELNRFKSSLANDIQNLSESSKLAIDLLKGSNGDLSKVREDVLKIQKEIQEQLITILNRPREIIKGSIKISNEVKNVILQGMESKTVDFSAIESLSDEIMDLSVDQVNKANAIIKQKRKELFPLLQKLSKADIQASRIIFIEDKVNAFTDLINRQIANLEYLLNDWKVLNGNMNQIKTDLKASMYADSSIVQNQFIQLKKINDQMNKQAKQFEDYVTKIKVDGV